MYALGSASPAESDMDPASDVAVVIPPLVRMLELLRLRTGVRTTFLSSGGAVYGEQRELAIPENVEPRPVSSYGIIKLTCEKYLAMYSERYDIPARYCGSRTSTGRASTRPRPGCRGAVDPQRDDGRAHAALQRRHVRARLRVCGRRRGRSRRVGLPAHTPELINIGTGVGHSLDEVVEQVTLASGRAPNVRPLESRTFDVRSNVLDTGLLRSLVEFSPRSLADGVAATWADLQRGAPFALDPPTAARAPGLSDSRPAG